jgi:hypothetical protein
MIPGACIVVPAVRVIDDKTFQRCNELFLALAVAGVRFMKVAYAPRCIAAFGLRVIENGKRGDIGAKQAGLWRENTAMIHAEEETEMSQGRLILLLEIPVFFVLASL